MKNPPNKISPLIEELLKQGKVTLHQGGQGTIVKLKVDENR